MDISNKALIIVLIEPGKLATSSSSLPSCCYHGKEQYWPVSFAIGKIGRSVSGTPFVLIRLSAGTSFHEPYQQYTDYNSELVPLEVSIFFALLYPKQHLHP